MTATEVAGALHPHSYKLGALCAFSVGDQILLVLGLSLLGKVAQSAGFFHNWDAPLFYPQGITPNTEAKMTN